MSFAKIETTQFNSLELSTGNLTSIATHNQQFTTNSTAFGGIMTSNSNLAVKGSAVSISEADVTETYSNIQYVTSVVPVVEEQEKYSSNLVTVNNATFVQMNDSSIKEVGVNSPLDIYLNVIPSTSDTPVVSTTSSSNQFKLDHLALIPNKKGNQYDEYNQIHQSPTMPLVSRSGRLIRRRPAYIAYIAENSQGLKDDEFMLQDLSNTNYNLKQDEDIPLQYNTLDEFQNQDTDNDMYSNNDEDDKFNSHTYTTNNGKKSLPHKKRIPNKLKNSKRGLKTFDCPQCSGKFTSPQQYSQHMTSHKKCFVCDICNESLDDQLKFFEHLKKHYEAPKKEIYPCETCKISCDSYSALQIHSEIHLKEMYKCDLCSNIFNTQALLNKHMEDHYTSSSFIKSASVSCILCPRTFKNQELLDDHINIDHHDTVSEFNCEDCNIDFKTRAMLIQHKKIEHKSELPNTKGTSKKKTKGKATKTPYTCEICGRTFIHKNSLVYHTRGHTGERPHQCDQCDKAFYAASALKVHLRLHSGEKPYKCKDCGKFFRQWGDLKYHTTSVHSDARLYQCEFCGKDFKRKYCLVVHRRIHTGEKNYKCGFCGKAFRAASYLQNHKRIHTGERPHPCPDCGKPFRVRSDMRRHRQTHNRVNNNIKPSTSTKTTVPSDLPVVSQISTDPDTSQNILPRLQIIQSSGHQIILTESGAVTAERPIKIMVSGLDNTTTNVPSESTISVGRAQIGNMTVAVVPPDSETTREVSTGIGQEVIMINGSSPQPIDLGMLPRMVTENQVDSLTQQEEPNSVATAENDSISENNRSGTIDIRPENNLYVWHSVFTS